MTRKKTVKYSEQLADEICDRIAGGESLRSICLDKEMPDRGSVMYWIHKVEGFSAKYAQARESQAEYFVDEMIAISDNEDQDVQRSKLMLETRRWIAEKMRPKKYGAKVEMEHSGQLEITTKEQRDAAVAAATRANS